MKGKMTKATSYCQFFNTETEAEWHMRCINHARRQAGNRRLLVLVDGPADNFAVMDMRSAIDMAVPYRW